MLLVILGHSGALPNSLLCVVYSFHMPLFFALSGYTFNPKKDFKTFIISKAKGFLVPYVFLCFILLFFHDIIFGIFNGVTVHDIWVHIIGIFVGFRKTKYYFSMWFIPVLFMAEIALYFIIRLIEKSKAKNILFIVCTLLFSYLTYLIFKLGFNVSIMSLDLVPAAVSFALLGYIFKTNKEKLLLFTKWYFLPVASVLNIISAYFGSQRFTVRTDLYECQISSFPWFILGAFFGIWAVFVLCINLKKCKPIEYIGKNSIVFYAFQNSLFIPISLIPLTHLKRIGFPDFWLSNTVFITLFTCFLSVIAAELIKNCTPFALGKFEKPKFFGLIKNGHSENSNHNT